MRVPAPTVVSFSISEPRPRMQSSAIVTRSRMHDWSPTTQLAPTLEPAKTIAPVETTVLSPIVVGGSGSRFAVECAPSDGGLPTTAYSRTRTPSPSTVPSYTVAVGWISANEGVREHLECAHHTGAVARHLPAVVPDGEELEEVFAFEPERLGGGHLRYVDVTRPELTVRPGALLVHGHLAVGLHVVEHRHLLPADHGHLPHLVRVEPREVHVRDPPAREAEEAEDDVLDARMDRCAALCGRKLGILVEQVEDHRQVVHPERPEGVLVRADDAEVHALAVDAQDVAELAGVDQLLQLQDGGVVEEEVAGHQHAVALLCEPHELVHLDRAHRRRLFHEDVLAGLERALRERMVRRHRRRDRNRVEAVVVEQIVEAPGRARLRVALGERV